MGVSRFESQATGCEARTLPLCYATPISLLLDYYTSIKIVVFRNVVENDAFLSPYPRLVSKVEVRDGPGRPVSYPNLLLSQKTISRLRFKFFRASPSTENIFERLKENTIFVVLSRHLPELDGFD